MTDHDHATVTAVFPTRPTPSISALGFDRHDFDRGWLVCQYAKEAREYDAISLEEYRLNADSVVQLGLDAFTYFLPGFLLACAAAKDYDALHEALLFAMWKDGGPTTRLCKAIEGMNSKQMKCARALATQLANVCEGTTDEGASKECETFFASLAE